MKSVYDFGHVRNKIYITNRKFDKHFSEINKGFGIPDNVLNKLSLGNTKYVLIITDNCDYLFHLQQYIDGVKHNNEVKPGVFELHKFVDIDNTIELPKHKAK